MRVWVIGRGIPDKKNGMLGSFELEQAQTLRKCGVEVVYFAISVRSARNLRDPGYSRRMIGDIPVESFNFPIGRFLPSHLKDAVFDSALRRMAARAIRDFGRPDIIHVHYPAQRPYGTLGQLQKEGARIVGTEHWSMVQNKTLGETYLRNLRTFVDNCDAIICVGSLLKESVRELTGTDKEIHVIPNVVNACFEAAPAEREGFRFTACGRLSPEKQFDKVVQAFADAFRDVPEVALTIAGGGTELLRIRSAAAASGLEDRITLTGMVPRREMAEIMARSDVLVSYSRYETFCVPVIEAWSCGVPTIVSTATPAMLDNPDERLGLSVDCDDPEALKKAMLQMYSRRGDYDPAWIRDYAEAHFSESAVADRLLRVYNTVF